MPVILSEIFGDPNVGVFSYANEKVAVVPAGIPSKKIRSYQQTLSVETHSTGLADSRLIGVYLAGNSNGMLVPEITGDDEVRRLEFATGLPVTIIRDRHTALGNLIVCNDYGAVVDPRFKPATVQIIEQVLKVPVQKETIAGLPHVGALAVASNKGALGSPLMNEEEQDNFSKALGVQVEVGTVNSGVPFPKAGVVVNSKGAVVGASTLGRELVAISNAFQTD